MVEEASTPDSPILTGEWEKHPPPELARRLEQLPEAEMLQVFQQFPLSLQGEVLSELPREKQVWIFRHMHLRDFARIFAHMDSAERVDLYQSLSPEEQAQLLPFLPPEVRREILSLSLYPPETAGGIMGTDFATVPEHLTVQEAIEYLRKHAPRKMIYYVYVTDENARLRGVVTLRELLLANPSRRISEIMKKDNLITASVLEDKEEVARKVDEYDLFAIPVVNEQNQIVGVVTHDQVIDVLREEQTEDVEKMVGIVPDEDFEHLYRGVPLYRHLQKRLPWLLILAILNIFTAYVLTHYLDQISAQQLLVLFMPLIAGMGGNSASQASTTIIRALALREILPRDWKRVLVQELGTGILLAGVIALAGALEVVFVMALAGYSWNQWEVIQLLKTVAVALWLQVSIATILGASLPLILYALKLDPAVASSPLLATILDVSGLMIFFTVASWFWFSGS